MSRPSLTLLVSAALATVSGCKDDSRPTLTGFFNAPAAVEDLPLAPPAEALTLGAPAPVGRLGSNAYGYAWAERAYAVDQTFYAAPPDYYFDYQGVEPWGWETTDHWTLYAEPLATGYRYYYYEPGEDYPYFVRDPDYGYGYDDAGQLVVVYTAAGLLLQPDYLYDRAPIAGRYWTRGVDLRRIGGRGDRRRVDEAVWRRHEPVFVRGQKTWISAARERPEWVSYRSREGGRELRRLEGERLRREGRGGGFAHDEAYRTYTPAADDRRFDRGGGDVRRGARAERRAARGWEGREEARARGREDRQARDGPVREERRSRERGEEVASRQDRWTRRPFAREDHGRSPERTGREERGRQAVREIDGGRWQERRERAAREPRSDPGRGRWNRETRERPGRDEGRRAAREAQGHGGEARREAEARADHGRREARMSQRADTGRRQAHEHRAEARAEGGGQDWQEARRDHDRARGPERRDRAEARNARQSGHDAATREGGGGDRGGGHGRGKKD